MTWDEYKMSSFTKIQTSVSQNVAKSTLKDQLHENKFITALYLSQLAYFKFSTASAKLSEFGARKLSLYNKGGTQGYFAELDDMVVVAFRGTEISRKEDLKNALTFWKYPFGKLKIHKGFFTSLEALIPEVIADLKRVDPSKRIVYVGHSMGGALATIMSLAHKPHELCTFGAPRVAGKEIAPLFDGIEYNRIVTKWDWIRWLPPNIPFVLSYEHSGDEYMLPCEWSWKHIVRSHLLVTYLQALLNNNN